MKKKSLVAVCLATILALSGCSNEASGKLTSQQISELQRPGIGGSGELNQNGVMAVNATEEELRGLVYHFVSGTMRINMDDLVKDIPNDELTQISEHISKIISALKGKDNGSISDDMLNYMLWEFAKTQKEWRLADNGVVFLGRDAATNRSFVDVTFVTTDSNKLQLPASNIITGSPLEDAEKALRRQEYLTYLDAWYAYNYGETMISSSGSIFSSSSTSNKDAALEKMDSALETFERHWGSVNYVLDEQQAWTMIERIREKIKAFDGSIPLAYDKEFYEYKGLTEETIKTNPPSGPLSSDDLRYVETHGVGTYTYSGIASQVTFDNEATMTFRFVLDFKAHLGTAKTLSTEGVYLRSYKLNNAQAEDGPMTRFTKDAIAKTNESVVAPFVDKLINRFQKCIEENDYPGLYKLFGQSNVLDPYTGRVTTSTPRFKDWDKYYSDMGKYCYIKYGAYNYKIIGWENNTLKVLVEREKKIRGKGTNMTMPTYRETALLTIVIDNDDLFINDEIILNTEVVGEPVSMLKDIQGMAEKLAYSSQTVSKETKASVLGALQVFSNAQLDFANSYTSHPENSNILEFGVPSGQPGSLYFGISAENLAKMRESMGVVAQQAPIEKITHVITWATVSNSYCKLRLRELFLFGENNAVDTEVYIGLTNTDGVWSVVSYDRTHAEYYNTAGQTEESLNKGCLCHDYLGEKPSINDFSSDDNVKPNQEAGASTENLGTVLDLGQRAEQQIAGPAVTTSQIDLPDAPDDLIVTTSVDGVQTPVITQPDTILQPTGGETTTGISVVSPDVTTEGIPADTTVPVDTPAVTTGEDPFGDF